MSEGNTILNGLAKVISTLFIEAVGGNLYRRTASDKSILGLTATQLRDELSVYRKAEVDSQFPHLLLVGTSTACDQDATGVFGICLKRLGVVVRVNKIVSK